MDFDADPDPGKFFIRIRILDPAISKSVREEIYSFIIEQVHNTKFINFIKNILQRSIDIISLYNIH